MSELNTNDALGNPIEFEKGYGYSTDNSGITKVTFGVAKKFTPKGYVSLKTVYTERGLYSDKPEKDIWGMLPRAKTVSVKSMKLFPVNLDDLNEVR